MNTLITKTTALGHDESVRRLRAAIASRGIREFAVFDHSAAANEVGLQLPGETVVVFGNPTVGTKLMTADPRVGVELPLHVLVHETDAGSEYVYRDPHAFADQFDLADVGEVLDALAHVLDAITEEAAQI